MMRRTLVTLAGTAVAVATVTVPATATTPRDRQQGAYSGALYRLTLADGAVRKIDAPPLASDDGMVLRGNTLDIARSVNNEVTVLRLSHEDTRGTVVAEHTYPGADTTTGIAVSGDRLLVTNSQLDAFLYGTPLRSPVFTVENLPLR